MARVIEAEPTLDAKPVFIGRAVAAFDALDGIVFDMEVILVYVSTDVSLTPVDSNGKGKTEPIESQDQGASAVCGLSVFCIRGVSPCQSATWGMWCIANDV